VNVALVRVYDILDRRVVLPGADRRDRVSRL
jgi:hypothetical protein